MTQKRADAMAVEGPRMASKPGRSSKRQSPWSLEKLPGDPMMWILIVSEIFVFGGALWAFAISEMLHPDIFREARAHLNIPVATLNTLILLTSGFIAAIAVRYANSGNLRMTRLSLLGAGVLGFLFILLKIMEYWQKFEMGVGLETNSFYTLYFLVTGFHLAHVVFGLIILAILAIWPSKDNLETGTAFWHMVDLIWLMIFPVFYLMGVGL
ncbi:MAG: cytochrome c oxidase subunit 3 family protein [Cohaesibacter sp.]|nr:cytochrome c oxidase subunit 3 family protein [Cohaesibacter sp.]MCV6600870.1 cytochrome c oxidase subunit 3 family protein [Cohaesibacter sp.]